jgi:hypothetical protein
LFPEVLIISFLLYSSSGVIKGNSLNIPKGLSESANQKGQTIIMTQSKKTKNCQQNTKEKRRHDCNYYKWNIYVVICDTFNGAGTAYPSREFEFIPGF